MYSLSSILQKPGRAALTISAIALAIALSVTLLSFGEGVRGGYGQLLEERGSDVYVGGAGSNLFLESLNIFDNGTSIAEDIETMGDVREAVPILNGYLPFYAVNESHWQDRNGTGIKRMSLHGVVAGGSTNFVGEDKPLLNGDGLKTPGDPRYNGGAYDGVFTAEIALSSMLADELVVIEGDTVYINTFVPLANEVGEWMENATPFTVTGITNMGGRRAAIHLSELQELSGLSNGEVSEIRVDIHDPSRAEAVASQIEDEHPVAAFTVEDMIGETERFISSFKGLANTLSAVAVGVAGIFTSTIMVIATHERKKELGLLRALGFRHESILGHVMSQALFLTLMGCFVGVLLGFGGVALVESILADQFSMFLPGSFRFSQVTLPIIVFSILVAFIVALVAGLLSYHQAMKIRVVEVLHGD